MGNTKHTSGPWEIRGNKIFIPGKPKSIATVHVHHNWDQLKAEPVEDVEQIANAKLIAAAPDLLAALQAMDELDKCEHLSDKWWQQAQKADLLRRRAISKATK